MNITFDTAAFENDPRGLISVLSHLRSRGCWSLLHDPDVERIVCRAPSYAYNLCRYVNKAAGVSRAAERVFLKNPSIGIRYLRLVNRRAFLDEDTQARFWKKVMKKPDLAYEWAQAFRERLSEAEEEVFVQDVRLAKSYSFFIIKGPFPEKVHQMLLLKSFEDMSAPRKKCLTEYIQYAASKSNS